MNNMGWVGIVAGVGIGLYHLITSSLPNIRGRQIIIVNTRNECITAIQRLISDSRIIGFDCEWNSGIRGKVALLQLASEHYCVLIRLFQFTFPDELKNFLSSTTYIKVGVDSIKDAQKLERDYNLTVNSTLDIRHLARMYGCEPRSLKYMSEKYLKLHLENCWCENWTTTNLTDNQIQYAALDAIVSYDLFMYFHLQKGGSISTWNTVTKYYSLFDYEFNYHAPTNYF